MGPWLDGNVAFITGGGSGIGRAVALRFLQEGAAGVAVFGRSAQKVAAIAALADLASARVLPLSGDVRSSADLKAAVDATIARFGRLDIVVPNAGIWDFQRSIHRMSGRRGRIQASPRTM